jgi:hypothetical protein
LTDGQGGRLVFRLSDITDSSHIDAKGREGNRNSYYFVIYILNCDKQNHLGHGDGGRNIQKQINESMNVKTGLNNL